MASKRSKKRVKGRRAGKKAAPPKEAPVVAQLKVLPALTKNQAKCLLFIFDYYSRHRHFPTQREIAEEMEIRSSTAVMYIDPLVEKGYLVRVEERGRNLRFTLDGLERLRLLGANVEEAVPG